MYSYEYWFDADGNPHEISKMDDRYIGNCIKQLKKMLDAGLIEQAEYDAKKSEILSSM